MPSKYIVRFHKFVCLLIIPNHNLVILIPGPNIRSWKVAQTRALERKKQRQKLNQVITHTKNHTCTYDTQCVLKFTNTHLSCPEQILYSVGYMFCARSTQWTCRFRFRTNQSDALEGGPPAIAQVSVFCLHSFSDLFIKILCWPCACGGVFFFFFFMYMRRYLEEVGYSDTILDMRSKRVRSLLGRNSPEANGPPPSEPPAEPEPHGGGESLLVRQIEEQIKRLEQHAFWHLIIRSAKYSPVGVCVQMKWSLEILIIIKINYLILFCSLKS